MSDVPDLASDDPIEWRGIAKGTPVIDAEGDRVGTVDELLGSDKEDIFIGIVVCHHVLDLYKIAIARIAIAADDISSMTRHSIVTSLTTAEIEALPRHTEERADEFGWVTVPFTYQYGPAGHVTTYRTESDLVKSR